MSVSVMRCSNCALLYCHPLPIPVDLQDHYGVPPDSYWTEEYFLTDPELYADVVATATDLLGPLAGRKALDIGAGIGKGMLALQRAGADVYGIEPSHSFHQHAIERMGIAPERLLRSSIEDAEFPKGLFDLIVLNVVLEHVYDPGSCVERIAKWLRPGGCIHIQVPSADWLISTLANTYHRLRCSEHVVNLSPLHEPFHLYEFTPSSFRLLADRLGLEVVRTRHFVCKTFMPSFLDPVLRWWMRRTGTGMQLDVWLREPGGAPSSGDPA